MRQFRKAATAAVVGLGALAIFATPGLTASDHDATGARAPTQLTHMGQKQGNPGGMMGPGIEYGHGAGQGSGPCPAAAMQRAEADDDLSADDVRAGIERILAWHGNERLKVGEVTEADDDTIIAEIVTLDGSLVDRFKVDRHSGLRQRIN